MRVYVIGAVGMLGRDVIAACEAAGVEARGFDLPELDLTSDLAPLDQAAPCDWLVNCAAYTDVDGAESEPDAAFAVNRDGPRHLARWCAANGVALAHISTDYVFDGKRLSPYPEDAPPAPLNVYGRSKLAGEEAVLESDAHGLVIRTQSLFGLHGRHFVSAILARLEAGDTVLRVVDDQTSCPTYTPHVADAILRLLADSRRGIVHVSASEKCTWHDFARHVVAATDARAEVQPISSAESKRPARRPAFSVLSKARYAAWTGAQLPTWRQGLEDYLARRADA